MGDPLGDVTLPIAVVNVDIGMGACVLAHRSTGCPATIKVRKPNSRAGEGGRSPTEPGARRGAGGPAAVAAIPG